MRRGWEVRAMHRNAGRRPLVAIVGCSLGVLVASSAFQPVKADPTMSHVSQPVAETPASDFARRLLEAAATSDAAFLAFAHASNPKSPVTDEQLLGLREQIKSLQVHSLEHASATHADLLVFDPNMEGWAEFSIDVAVEEPRTVTGLRIRPADRPSDVAAPPRLNRAALVATTRTRVDAAVKDDQFSGAVLIAENGRTIYEQAVGLADREAATRNTTQTQFRFGSMGKMFTAVSIMQLAQAGKLDLTAPIGRYLKDYPNANIATKVTINNLLTHTGGTGDIFTPEFFAHRLELKDPKDYVALFGARPPLFAPGAKSEYSNYGFMLLGRIVEVVSGETYDDYIARHIFAPAHMTATGNEPEAVHLARRSTGYMTQKGQLVSNADTLPWRGMPAGGGYSTVEDLRSFADALMANRLLDPAYTKLLTTGGITGPDGQLVRYDFGAPASDGRRYFGHAGGAPGMNGELRIFPAEPSQDAFVIVVLANRSPPVATGIANFISNRLP
jgi:D-alanyl-D-alanine carboxypeptidase